MNLAFYNYTIYTLCCSSLLCTAVWRHPLYLLPTGTPLTVFKWVAPLTSVLCIAWLVAGLISFGWQIPLMGLVIGGAAALIFDLFTRPNAMVYAAAVKLGALGTLLSLAQIYYF